MSNMSSCTSGEGPILPPPPHVTALPPDNSKVLPPNSRQTPNIRLHIHPSGLIKSPIVNKLMRRKLTSSDPNQDRLAAEEYKAKRLISLARARRLRVAAEERHGLSELQEFRVLINAAKEGAEFTSLDPQTAIDLARAARDTLAAEEKLEQLKVAECEEQLAILRDSAEAAHARFQDSNLQVDRILAILNDHRIRVDPPVNLVADCLNSIATSSRTTGFSDTILPDDFSDYGTDDGVDQETLNGQHSAT